MQEKENRATEGKQAFMRRINVVFYTARFRKSNHTGWFEETRSSRSNFIKILFDKKKSKQPSVDCSLPFLVIKISLQALKKKKKKKIHHNILIFMQINHTAIIVSPWWCEVREQHKERDR